MGHQCGRGSFLSVSGERSWQSNDGYRDVLGSHYVHDSGVVYRLQVEAGDLVIVRDKEVVLGIARRFLLLPKREVARGEPSRKVGQNQSSVIADMCSRAPLAS